MHPHARIIFLDVDGTIIDGHERMAASTPEAIRRARAAGHLVYLATGRSRAEIFPHVAEIGFDGAITAGGGFAEIGDRLIASHTMSADELETLTEVLEDERLDYYLQAAERVYASPGMLEHYFRLMREGLIPDDESAEGVPETLLPETSAHEAPADATPADVYAPLADAPRDAIAKVLFLGEDDRAYARVVRRLGDRFTVITGTIAHLGGASGEISPLGVDKGRAALDVLADLGVPAERAVAIGDSVNDLQILERVGLGIAMGNASAEVKAVADEQTTHVLDDGIWNAFVRHGLI
ncbi:HAD family hydrolase [Agromyces aerolatus]|uniref:HAD family hydrolase n=1 Tax=Agromyces sp. LY-1074 TaxID=3074080 RepID=UPI00285852D8|nr:MULTISPECIES: HAD family hydrolase [unclassified Agromyces]MDR5700030.1 HAD family hydrolase [Agromyces sp. LY-1074]MDR5706158.1 HAD family hydrolase [Agromyces sp. LY-1358]